MNDPPGSRHSGHTQIDRPVEPSQAKPPSSLRSSTGWDGKLRIAPKSAALTHPDALSDPEYSDPEAPPRQQLPADEDLLDDEDENSEDIDLVHCRITSLSALRLQRFRRLKRLCLRQNGIEHIHLPSELADTLEELDFYDNLIGHIKGLEQFTRLKTLDLSFNKIKHIKNLEPLTALTELYLVQNRISKIENLEILTNLTMIELAANRVREIEGLEALVCLRELWLGKNKITEIKGIGQLKQLRLLDLKSNRLTKISGLDELPELEELYVSHNAITAIGPSSFKTNTKLRVLDISSNQIGKLENVSHLAQLEEFWASSNQLADFRDVERELGGKIKLETVYFEANPLQINGPVVYRNKVKLALPQVKQIDATFVRV